MRGLIRAFKGESDSCARRVNLKATNLGLLRYAYDAILNYLTYRVGTMALFRAKGPVDGSKASLKTRFRAWWEGYELDPSARPAANIAAAPGTKAKAAQPQPGIVPLYPWETPRMRIQQQIWGAGYHKPGGNDYILMLVKPFALNPSMCVMELGAGLGGGTRVIASEFGIGVSGYEPSAELAKAGKELSIMAGLEKKAEVIRYDEEQFAPRDGAYDCILSSETLFLLEDKDKLLIKLERALKTHGQIVVTDFVRADDVPDTDARLQGLEGSDGVCKVFWSTADYVRRFRELNFDLWVNEDMTINYRRLAMDGWVTFTQSGGEKSANARAFPDALVAEVELWTRRMAAMDSGAIKVMRFYAVKLGSNKLMSNS